MSIVYSDTEIGEFGIRFQMAQVWINEGVCTFYLLISSLSFQFHSCWVYNAFVFYTGFETDEKGEKKKNEVLFSFINILKLLIGSMMS